MRRLDKIKYVNNVYVVMDAHTILHNSENLLSCLNKKYDENCVKMCVSLNNGDIPKDLEILFNKEENIIKNIA